jgi:serine-aspartate repeat-containing protein C/D/E
VRNDSNGVAVAASTSQASVLTPPYGSSDFTFDFGFRPRIYVGNRVWFDVDNDGVQAPSEAGIANVTVRLLSSTGTVLASTVTDASGYYEFDSFTAPIVPGGAYTLSVPLAQAPLATLQPTAANADTAIEETDSDGVLSRAAARARRRLSPATGAPTSRLWATLAW